MDKKNDTEKKDKPKTEKLTLGQIKKLMWDGDRYERGRGGAIRRK